MGFSAQMPMFTVVLGMPAWLLVTIGAILGAIIGSFLGTVAVRLPAGRGIIRAPSACDSCRQRLRPWHLVPIVSWLALRGRCQSCAAPIGRGQLAAEVLGAAIGALAWWAPIGLALPAMVLGWQLLLLGLLDARCLWLPWRLNAALALSGLAVAVADNCLPFALAGGGLAYGLLALVAWGYRRARGREGLGGGDPLLLGAIGLWVGPVGAVHVLLGAALLGLAVAGLMAWRGGRIDAATRLPLGTFLAAAAWPVFVLDLR